MNTEIKNVVSMTDKDAQYDERAKRLLGNKIILAHILTKTIDEFRGMDAKEAASYIEGDPYIGTVLVEPGLTNSVKEQDGQRIVGMNTENVEVNEGMIRFDIIFYVRMKDGISQIIINLEAQKEEPSGYRILNRAVFYVSRLISSQKERDFVKMNYNDIKPVFSIWICMNMNENSMDHIHLTDDKLFGSHQWQGGLNLLNIIMIGIAAELPEYEERYELHRLLSAVLSAELSVDEKARIMETEYGIPINEEVKEEMSAMCNLSQGIREKGRTEGEERIILNMYQNHFTLEQIALATSRSVEEVKAVLRKH